MGILCVSTVHNSAGHRQLHSNALRLTQQLSSHVHNLVHVAAGMLQHPAWQTAHTAAAVDYALYMLLACAHSYGMPCSHHDVPSHARCRRTASPCGVVAPARQRQLPPALMPLSDNSAVLMYKPAAHVRTLVSAKKVRSSCSAAVLALLTPSIAAVLPLAEQHGTLVLNSCLVVSSCLWALTLQGSTVQSAVAAHTPSHSEDAGRGPLTAAVIADTALPAQAVQFILELAALAHVHTQLNQLRLGRRLSCKQQSCGVSARHDVTSSSTPKASRKKQSKAESHAPPPHAKVHCHL